MNTAPDFDPSDLYPNEYRDIVQFVPLREVKSGRNNFTLSKEVLAEMPGQIMKYMSVRGIQPRPPAPRSFKLQTLHSFSSVADPSGGYPQYPPAQGQPPYQQPGYPGVAAGQPPYAGAPVQPGYPGVMGQGPYSNVQGQSPYPQGVPPTGQSPYPQGVPPTGQSPYPQGVPPTGQSPYPQGVPPTGQSPYPQGVPPTGQSPYPQGVPPTGQSPYPQGVPPTGQPPYPQVGPESAGNIPSDQLAALSISPPVEPSAPPP